MDNIDFLSEHDFIRYKQSGKIYEGYITKVVNNDFPFIECRVQETNDFSERMGSFFNGIIYAKSFKGLEVEWWFDGQGCDNSAIGVSGSWELICS